MPAMANIVVQDSIPANRTFNAISASAGDKVPAVWRETGFHQNIGFQPRFSTVFRDNAAGNGRNFNMAFNAAIVQTDANGNDFVAARFPLQISGVLPTNVSSGEVLDWYYIASNLAASSLVRACIQDAAGPT